MTESGIGVVVFFALALMTLLGAAFVAFSRNIVHSAFALLGSFLGVAGLYAYAAADLVAVIQLLVYVGGVAVLILFAVMLTSRVGVAEMPKPEYRWLGFAPGAAVTVAGAAAAWAYGYVTGDRTTMWLGIALCGGALVLVGAIWILAELYRDPDVSNPSTGLVAGVLALVAVATVTSFIAGRLPWSRWFASAPEPTSESIGDALLGEYVLPFEIVSILLLAVLIGAVALARGRPRGAGTTMGAAASTSTTTTTKGREEG